MNWYQLLSSEHNNYWKREKCKCFFTIFVGNEIRLFCSDYDADYDIRIIVLSQVTNWRGLIHALDYTFTYFKVEYNECDELNFKFLMRFWQSRDYELAFRVTLRTKVNDLLTRQCPQLAMHQVFQKVKIVRKHFYFIYSNEVFIIQKKKNVSRYHHTVANRLNAFRLLGRFR